VRLTETPLVTAAGVLLGIAWALAACGGDGSSARAGSTQQLLTDAAVAAREQGTLTFTFEYVRTHADRPDEPERYGSGDGALDVSAGRGRMRFEFDLGPSSGTGSAIEEPFELRWDRQWLEAEVDGKSKQMARETARRGAGLVGRLPDEPEAMLALLEHATDARRVGEKALDGERLTVVRFEVDSQTAGLLGAPAELTGAAAAGMLDERFRLEAWIGEDRLARRVVLTIDLEPVSSGGELVLPARTLSVTYDLAAYGEPVTELEFES